MLARITFIITAVLLISAVVFFWMSPWSPAVPYRARQRVVQGDIHGAVQLLRWRAENAIDPQIHIESLWEAAQLIALKTEDKNQAILLLKRCIHTNQFQHGARAHSYIASLLSSNNPRMAVFHWKQAILLAPDHKDKGRWWVRTASLYERLGEEEDAISAWTEASRIDKVMNMAHLALGRLQLKSNPKEALEHFQAAQEDQSKERSRSAELGAQLARWEIKEQLFSEEQKKPIPRRRRR